MMRAVFCKVVSGSTISTSRVMHSLTFMMTSIRSVREITAFGVNARKAKPIRLPGTKVPRFHSHRSEEHTSELQSLMRISYAVFCLKKKNTQKKPHGRTHLNTTTEQNNQINAHE